MKKSKEIILTFVETVFEFLKILMQMRHILAQQPV